MQMIPAIDIGGARVFLGDCRDVLRGLPDNSVDSIVTDPPYGLGFMGKEWDSFGKKGGISDEVRAKQQEKWGTKFAASAKSAKPSDGEMLAFQLWCTEWATECLRVLKPGGHILAFGGSRTWHRLAVAVEDAGFELRDSIAWIYGSGFPKSLDVSKAIDKSDAKVERRARDLRFVNWMRSTGLKAAEINNIIGKSDIGSHYLRIDQPVVATAELFDKLRPYLPDVPEDIERLVFERTVESKNFAERKVIGQKTGVAGSGFGNVGHGLQSGLIDETLPATSEAQKWQGWGTALKPAFEPVVVGRKPLVGTVAENVLAWGVGGLNIDATRINNLTEAEKNWTPQRQHANNPMKIGGAKPGDKIAMYKPGGRWPANVILDEVTAGLLDEQSGVLKSGAHNGKSVYSEGSTKTPSSFVQGMAGKVRNRTTPANEGGASRFFYVAKASRRDRNEGLEELQEKTPGQKYGLTAGGALPQQTPHKAEPVKNFHPTVKPTQLMRYLIKLVTPEGGVVLDPFTGSGSTGKAALLDGYGFIGAELTEEYLPIIEGRLRWASEQKGEDDDTLF
jgi:DNA modification methylase